MARFSRSLATRYFFSTCGIITGSLIITLVSRGIISALIRGSLASSLVRRSIIATTLIPTTEEIVCSVSTLVRLLITLCLTDQAFKEAPIDLLGNQTTQHFSRESHDSTLARRSAFLKRSSMTSQSSSFIIATT